MPDFTLEKQHGRNRGLTICGVDEAGRGPLAGPVTAAAVILPAKLPRAIRSEIRDSKKMTPQQREDLFEPLKRISVYAIAEASVEEIARYNILWASMLAMKRAVEGLENFLREEWRNSPPLVGGVRGGGAQQKIKLGSCGNSPLPDPPHKGEGISALSPRPVSSIPKIDVALIDGNRCPQIECKAVAIIEGDDKSLSIAAASILAKVTRDRLMKKLAAEHPGYGWETNMGYGTRAHLDALRQLGPTKWHRDSFAPVYQLDLLTG